MFFPQPTLLEIYITYIIKLQYIVWYPIIKKGSHSDEWMDKIIII